MVGEGGYVIGWKAVGVWYVGWGGKGLHFDFPPSYSATITVRLPMAIAQRLQFDCPIAIAIANPPFNALCVNEGD